MPGLSERDRADLLALEESLWRARTRWDRDHMTRTLAPDFSEVGRSGRTYTRAQILDLAGGEIDATLRDLDVRAVGPGVALVTYVSEVRDGDGVQVSRRSSLWVRGADGWRLRFHQGTPVPGA